MKLLHGFDEPQAYRGGYVSIGNFDGVHLGHQRIVGELVQTAHQQTRPAVVFTFDPHPVYLLRPQDAPPSLSTLERKAELLDRCGVDCLIAFPTTKALLALEPEQFFEQIIRGELQARGLVEGPNFRFGHNRRGDVEMLERLCTEARLTLTIVPPVVIEGRVVSSSVIRKLIAEGRIAQAVALLGHPYRLTGRVEPGADRGRSIGFPTANLTAVKTLIPPDGVYAGIGHVQGRPFPAAVHIGPNPTFGEAQRKLEVHLVGFEGELYGSRLDVDLLERLRAIRRFENVETLKQQLQEDVAEAVRIFDAHRSRQ